MSRPRRRPLTSRVVHVPDPTPQATLDRVLDLLADALADQAIAEARAEVAARLDTTEDGIDRERSRLDPDDRAWLDRLSAGAAR